MKLTVLIPTWRRPRELANCLDGLELQTRRPDEVLVVARNEDTETLSLLERRQGSGGQALRAVRVDSPGQVRSLQVGLTEAEGEGVAITDDDAVPRPDWLERIERCLTEQPAVGGVGGRDWVHGGERVHAGSRRGVGKIRWYGRVIGNHHLGVGEARAVDLLKGVNMAFRRDALRGVRIAEGLRGGGAQVHSDMDICLAVKRLGWTLVYDPAIAVDHYPAERFDEDQREGRPAVALQDEVYNEAYVLARRLPPRRAALPLLYGLLVGRRGAPGLLVAIERAARGEHTGALLRACTRTRVEALAAALRVPNHPRPTSNDGWSRHGDCS
jgi:GT2 family glycosyltransferase